MTKPTSPDFTVPDGLVHHFINRSGRKLHIAEVGTGPDLVFVHGWPEFWMTWLPVVNLLKDHFRCLMPCLYGFGLSDKPDQLRDDLDADFHASDIQGLINHFCASPPVIIGHDVGSYVLQSLGLKKTFGRDDVQLKGLVFLNCPTASVGRHWVNDGHVNEIWYQSFHLTPLALELVGHSRETVALYFRHFLKHWTSQKHSFDTVFEKWVDNFSSKNALIGGFSWYNSNNAKRVATIDGKAGVPAEKIQLPSAVLWGCDDPVLKSQWSAFLNQHFSHIHVKIAEDCGHFVHVEQAVEAARFISRFAEQINTADTNP